MTGCCAHVLCVSICDKSSHMYSQLLGGLCGERTVSGTSCASRSYAVSTFEKRLRINNFLGLSINNV